MSTRERTCLLISVCIIVLAAAVPIYFFVLTDSSGQPYCHKQVDMALHNWQEMKKTKQFPNVNGSSEKSLAEIVPYLGGVNLHDKYMYVPGLQRDDPGDLVLMYLRQPTRWTWHVGLKPSIFGDTAWILVPVDMKFYGPKRNAGPGEFSERVPFNELCRRLKDTLEYLERNQRPNWQTVAEEHSQFLKNIEEGA